MQRNSIMEKRQLSYVFNFKLLQGQLNGIFMLFVDDVLVIDLDDINYRQGKTDMELIYSIEPIVICLLNLQYNNFNLLDFLIFNLS